MRKERLRLSMSIKFIMMVPGQDSNSQVKGMSRAKIYRIGASYIPRSEYLSASWLWSQL